MDKVAFDCSWHGFRRWFLESLCGKVNVKTTYMIGKCPLKRINFRKPMEICRLL